MTNVTNELSLCWKNSSDEYKEEATKLIEKIVLTCRKKIQIRAEKNALQSLRGILDEIETADWDGHIKIEGEDITKLAFATLQQSQIDLSEHRSLTFKGEMSFNLETMALGSLLKDKKKIQTPTEPS